MTTDLGSGIRLSSDFDLVLDEQSGDLDQSSQLNELSKDLSLSVVEVLRYGTTERLPDVYSNLSIPESIENEGVVGQFLSGGLLSDAEILVANVINVDPRIDIVTRVDAQKDTSDPDTVVIEVDAVIEELSEEESFEFVVRPS